MSVNILYRAPLVDHYIIAFHVAFILLAATTLVTLLSKKQPIIIIIVCTLFFIINIPAYHLFDYTSQIQEGISMNDFQTVAQLIRMDNHGSAFNVTMDAQADNRAMPIRYFLYINSVTPLSVEAYPQAKTLYFLKSNKTSLSKITTWEYSSFRQKPVTKKWHINNEYSLQKIEK